MNVNQLYDSAKALLMLGEDGSPIYADEFCRMNMEVFKLTNELFGTLTSSVDEEAKLCISLFLGLSATIYSGEDKQGKVQHVLDRSSEVLPLLDNSLLKCELLLACYQEVKDNELLEEAKKVIMSWGGRELIEEEIKMMERWNEIANNSPS